MFFFGGLYVEDFLLIDDLTANPIIIIKVK